jgi:pimeloyl-ACP methyl ester carboxylesterase
MPALSQAVIARFQSSTPAELTELFLDPTPDEETTLRAYLGEPRFHRLRDVALRTRVRGAPTRKLPVVVLPGIMGSELTSCHHGKQARVWMNYLGILCGWLDRLQLAPDGRSPFNAEYDVFASGILNKYYGELLIALSARWDVLPFFYDWRKDLDLASSELAARIQSRFGDQRVHLIAHSMGGLVARGLLRSEQDKGESSRLKLGRLVMLGTPNRGSFEVPQIITGIQETVEMLVRVLAARGFARREAVRQELCKVLDSFAGMLQMLPAPSVAPELYKAATYQPFGVSLEAAHLENACRRHTWLAQQAIHPDQMFYIAGCNRPTITGILDSDKLDDLSGYEVSMEGDGRVPHALGPIQGVDTYWIEETHGDLPSNAQVMAALEELLVSGSTTVLARQRPPLPERGPSMPDPRRLLERERQARAARLEDLLDDLAPASRGRRTVDAPMTVAEPGIQEHAAEDLLASGFLPATPGIAASAAPAGPPTNPRQVTVRLIRGKIEAAHGTQGHNPVDSISVGQYLGVKPQTAYLALDQAISQALARRRPADAPSDQTNRDSDGDLLFTQAVERGVLRGELGQFFFVDDPRAPQPADDQTSQRLIAVAGMGMPGRCGAPELLLLVRDLCWTLERLGKKHLATVLIGGGEGNLTPTQCVSAWLRGIAAAADSVTGPWGLEEITFVEYDGRKLRAIQQAIETEARRSTRLTVLFQPLSEDELRTQAVAAVQHQLDKLQQRAKQGDDVMSAARSGNVTRLTVTFEEGAFVFSAITDTAAIPERRLKINPKRIDDANQALVAATGLREQVEAGQTLGQLLVPEELRAELLSDCPLVLMLDTTAAQIHWEMLAPNANDLLARLCAGDGPIDPRLCYELFLGTGRSLTRQLITMFAHPTAVRPRAGALRVLVVADPDREAPLKGAAEEGLQVADLFEKFGRRYEVAVTVKRLIGPTDATVHNVLHELIAHRYDVLHYSGHCFYNPEDPGASGWLFSAGDILSGYDLGRVDRVPRFVFSNACESGVTPDRAQDRSPNLAPSFAETFFQRGVENFICTAWPVHDRAARQFAHTLYSSMLRLDDDSASTALGWTAFRPVHEALLVARRALGVDEAGLRTWGAYQHYGNPDFRLMEGARRRRPSSPAAGGSAGGGGDSGSPKPGGPPKLAEPAQPGEPSKPVEPPQPSNLERWIEPDTAESFERIRRDLLAPGTAGVRKLDQLRSLPGICGQPRLGFQIADGWISDTPAVIVKVTPGHESEAERRLSELKLGVPVDIRPASPIEQLGTAGQSRSLRGAPPASFPGVGEPLALPPIEAEAPRPDEDQGERGRTITVDYEPPPGAKLQAVKGPIRLACHVSPDAGWPTLKQFFEAVRRKLVVGMYDFTAPHVLESLQQALVRTDGELQIVLDPQLALQTGGDGENPKAHDRTEDDVREALEDSLAGRLSFVWAAVKTAGKVSESIFPSAYHIKLAVRDGRTFWVSSGNWQSTNQSPFPRPRPDETPTHFFQTFNREWHVVVDHPDLARTFEQYLKQDFKQAAPLQSAEGERGVLVLPDLIVPEGEELEQRAAPQYFEPQVFEFTATDRVKVQPLLTPDNYAEHVLKVINSAQEKLYFQNQYIRIAKNPEPEFLELLEALRKKARELEDVRIILRDLAGVEDIIEALKVHGFPTDRNHVRVQKACHNKGIIVDSKVVVLGSHNWSSDGTCRNRDASLVIYHPDVAQYYEQVFLYDWQRIGGRALNPRRDMPVLADLVRLDSATGQARDLRGRPLFRGTEDVARAGIRIPWGAYFED